VNSAKQTEIHKRGLPAFVVFPALLKSGKKLRFDLIFGALYQDKSTDNILCGNIDLIEGDKQLK